MLSCATDGGVHAPRGLAVAIFIDLRRPMAGGVDTAREDPQAGPELVLELGVEQR